MTHHSLPVRVYYEDTDVGGVVYYANYLRFIERGRSDWLRDLGVDQTAMKRDGVVFVVRHLTADYLRSAHFEDMLCVDTDLVEIGGAKLIFDQRVLRGDDLLFTARVVVVCVGLATGAAVRIPPAVRDVLPVP
ncbi:tol-pal system-associated acyl-CoA thioesterase [Paracoccus sp. p4-l81]|uniref:tol-pal system-associated acyl-CoA thioesterase n=1 Tax=unclassified Paracoccus (in: a-proteobacteria) TaxID=2688777 RepID=UPI0035B9BB72